MKRLPALAISSRKPEVSTTPMSKIADYVKLGLMKLSMNRILVRGRPGERRLYLTFDDGPSAVHTPPILELLDQHGVKATFFVVGRDAQVRPELVRRLVASGHELGNHTLIHPRMDFLSKRGRDLEINGMEQLLANFDGGVPHYFRPPYGGLSISLLTYCLAAGHRVALWSRDSLDYGGDAERVVAAFELKQPVAGDILLFHDDGVTARLALARLLPRWLAAGFSFHTLSDALK
jgi:peptidoglycan-N-acetylglucosamine deacetylase